jgi:hypothetical protein
VTEVTVNVFLRDPEAQDIPVWESIVDHVDPSFDPAMTHVVGTLALSLRDWNEYDPRTNAKGTWSWIHSPS